MVFEIFDDDAFGKRADLILLIILFSLSLFLLLSTSSNSNAFTYVLVLSATMLILSQTNFHVFAGFGSKGSAYKALAIGLGLGLILGFSSRNTTGLNIILPVQALFDLGNLSFFFINIVAPILEAFAFRSFLYPFLVKFFLRFIKNDLYAKIAALALAASIFGFYHLAAYFSQTNSIPNTAMLIQLATFYGALFIMGTFTLESIAFEIGLHFTNNVFAIGCSSSATTAAQRISTCSFSTDQILPLVVIFTIAMIILFEISDRLK